MARKSSCFEELSWLKFNNLGLELGINLKFYTSVENLLKLKVKKFWRLIITFAKSKWVKLVRGLPSPPILNRSIINRPKI